MGKKSEVHELSSLERNMRAKLRRFTDHTQLHRAHFVSILSRDKVVHQQLVWASRSLGARGSIHTSGEAGHKAGLTCATCMCLGVRKVRERKKEQTQKKQSRTAEDVFSVSLLIEACSLRSQHHEQEELQVLKRNQDVSKCSEEDGFQKDMELLSLAKSGAAITPPPAGFLLWGTLLDRP